MAGHRKGTGKPKRSTARMQRLRARLEVELAVQDTPGGRVAVASEYLRAVLARYPAADVAEDVVACLIEAGDRIQHRQGATQMTMTERRGGAS